MPAAKTRPPEEVAKKAPHTVMNRRKRPTGRPNGRPPVYTPELASEICMLLMEGNSLRDACIAAGVGISTVMRWLNNDTGGFWAQYARAREVQAEIYGEDTLAIADEDGQTVMKVVEWVAVMRDGVEVQVPCQVAYDQTAVARQRLRVTSRQWYIERMAAKRFGGLPEGAAAGGVMLFVKDLTGRKD